MKNINLQLRKRFETETLKRLNRKAMIVPPRLKLKEDTEDNFKKRRGSTK